MLDKLIHKWLKVPYSLNVRFIQRPKKPLATILFIHGIGSNGDAWKDVITQLPDDIRIITIDLLGFGDSPQPEWALYDARTQANSVLATYFKLRIRGKITIVGHSLGSLVAVEIAKRYPLLVRSLVLCSPPFYNFDESKFRLPKADKTLRRLYTSVSNNPDQFVKLTAFAIKYKLLDKSYDITLDNVDSYMAALNAMIINQTSYADVQTLGMPIKIIRGSLDPFVVAKNLRRIVKNRQNIHLQTIVAGHEVKGFFIPAVVKSIEQYGATKISRSKR
jgi:pimeloyl-ACP methyl ester carboxylesterase